jgi:hypothetical protein
LHYAIMNAIERDRYSKAIDILLEAGADPNFKNIQGESAKSIVDKKANEGVKKSFDKAVAHAKAGKKNKKTK